MNKVELSQSKKQLFRVLNKFTLLKGCSNNDDDDSDDATVTTGDDIKVAVYTMTMIW